MCDRRRRHAHSLARPGFFFDHLHHFKAYTDIVYSTASWKNRQIRNASSQGYGAQCSHKPLGFSPFLTFAQRLTRRSAAGGKGKHAEAKLEYLKQIKAWRNACF